MQSETEKLQRRIRKLQEDNRAYREQAHDRAELALFLKERVKELNCLYGITQQVERCGDSVEKLLQGIVELLPGSWQFPEISCARIRLEDRDYVTSGFRKSRWRQAAAINVGEKEAGVVEVYYLKKMPDLDEGPFLKEERLLVNAVGERIGRVTERIHAKQQLEVERASLNNMNIALREVLARVRDERKEAAKAVQTNVDNIIMPTLDALEAEVPAEQRAYVTLAKRNLEEITSPFSDQLGRAFMKLSPAEIQICDMVRRGLSTKEISRLRHISPATVSRHREHIRRKLEVTNKNVNLATFLQNFMAE